MQRAYVLIWLAFGTVLAGCSTLSEMVGVGHELIPEGAVIERDFGTDETWMTFAAPEPLSKRARSDVEQYWASPRYGASGWVPAIADGEANNPSFRGAKWIWYPEEGFQFGGVNSMPENKKVVHFRREFYNDRIKAEIGEATVTVMTSGKVSYRVYVNGVLVKLGGEEYERLYGRPGQRRFRMMTPEEEARRYTVQDESPRNYDIKEHLRVGKNVIAIEAETHIANEVEGQQSVPNFVRRGVIARVHIE
ncbi:MAG: hypothetical protein KatS3mg115_2594 [Candidatus Poribacteria bacterium]|nr:MAG: hypothetical protein KatS3mg115_2594 [Candidatus Poribacteria bacterium]